MSIVTAVIPCYNAAAFLGDAIASAKNQTHSVAEIIVVDDGSTDDSAALARRAGARVVPTGGQRGPASARNIGLAEVRTTHVAFLDADDQWLPSHCETLLALLGRAPDAAMAFGRIRHLAEGGDRPAERRAFSGSETGLLNLLIDNPIAQSAVVAVRDRLLEVGGYQDGWRHAEDYDLWLRVAERFPILASDEVTCRYRVHPGQATAALAAVVRAAWEARLSCRDRLRDAGRLTPAHQAALCEALRREARIAWALADQESLTLLVELARLLEAPPSDTRAVRNRLRFLPLRRCVLAVRQWYRPAPMAG